MVCSSDQNIYLSAQGSGNHRDRHVIGATMIGTQRSAYPNISAFIFVMFFT